MSMRVGGVWVPNSLAPRRFLSRAIQTASSPTSLKRDSGSRNPQPSGFRYDSLVVPTSGTVSSNGNGPLSHIVPALGVAGLLITGAMRLHPYTAAAALFIGVGIAVLNYGSEPAGSGAEVGVETQPQPDWLNPHF